ncbi:MAG: diaminopimelate decarboxylase [Elusimicrobia bacterium]|nr:diaminopimelate decarboxylase [Elusimicrobiota bacterium]
MSNLFPPKLVKKIIKKTGTPVYIYSKAKILNNLAAYRKAFSELDFVLCYAMKANSSGGIVRLLSEKGAGADVVSGGELYRALKAGFKPEKIIFSGVGKTAGELAYALRSKILLINVESFEELRALSAVAARLRLKAPVSVRINPDIDPHTHKFITTGKLGTKFGVDFKEAGKLYAFAAADRNLVPLGLHFHLGSQIDSPQPYILALGLVKKFIFSLQRGGINLKYLDIGGGWGVKEGFEMLPLERLAKAAGSALKSLPGMRLIIEPGRSLVTSAGALAVSVLYRKKSGHVSYAITDGAMNDFIRPAFYGARHPIVPLEKRKGPAVKLDIAGPICESGDFLAKNVKLPLPERGDILLVMSAGAYGFSMSSNYNSRPRAPEVLITGPSSWKLIRKRETFRDLTAREI